MTPSARAHAACLFDLDGTLIDSAPDLHASLNHCLHRRDLPSVDEDLVRRWVGQGARRLIEQALAQLGQPAVAADIDAMFAAFLDYYEAHVVEHSRLYPGVQETLGALHAAGIPMACVTNKYEGLSRHLLAEIGLADFLPVVIGGDTLDERKPHPAPLLEACARLRQPVARSLMVGDSSNDIDAARAAGMPVVCVSYGYNHGEDIHAAGADAVVDSLLALI